MSTAHSISITGARPVFVDCNSYNGTIDINKINDKNNKKNKSNIYSSPFGKSSRCTMCS